MRETKPYKCTQCTKTFANSSYLSQHSRIHLGIKPYHCELCQRKFTQLSHLQQHERTHTGDKPYKCRYGNCTKAFSQLSNLQSHSRSHQTDKPFKCNSCYKCFTDESALLDHIPKHKDSKHLKTHICQYCGKSYTQESYLQKHLQKHTDRMSSVGGGGGGGNSSSSGLVVATKRNLSTSAHHHQIHQQQQQQIQQHSHQQQHGDNSTAAATSSTIHLIDNNNIHYWSKSNPLECNINSTQLSSQNVNRQQNHCVIPASAFDPSSSTIYLNNSGLDLQMIANNTNKLSTNSAAATTFSLPQNSINSANNQALRMTSYLSAYEPLNFPNKISGMDTITGMVVATTNASGSGNIHTGKKSSATSIVTNLSSLDKNSAVNQTIAFPNQLIALNQIRNYASMPITSTSNIVGTIVGNEQQQHPISLKESTD